MPLESFIAQKTVLECRDDKMKVVHRRILSILDGLFRSRDGRFEETISSSSCWRLVRLLYRTAVIYQRVILVLCTVWKYGTPSLYPGFG